MGREKIEMKYIKEGARRRSTLKKRMRGLMKKAMELHILCDTKIMVIAINDNMDETHPTSAENHLVQTYCSTGEAVEFWKTYMASTRKKAKVTRASFDTSLLQEKSDAEKEA